MKLAIFHQKSIYTKLKIFQQKMIGKSQICGLKLKLYIFSSIFIYIK